MSMTFSVRARFMACFEMRFGRPATLSRKEINDFISFYEKDPYPGISLKFPSWLTTNSSYRSGRGNYRLPWSELDEFYKNNPEFKENLTKAEQTRREALAHKPICSLY